MPETNTYVSNPGYPNYNEGSGNTNGASAPGASMQVTHGVLTIIGGAFVGLFVLGFITRKSYKKI